MISKEVIILGGGAAGLMCAIEAAKRGKTVAVLEHNQAIAKKIRISGGGRCNFTNINASPRNYLSNNEHFVKSALARYTPDDFIRWVEEYQIPYHEKTLGQLFCDGSSQDIIGMLSKESRRHHVEIFLSTHVQQIKKENTFHIITDREVFQSSALVVATGGLSIPELGATALGYQIAQQFGITINPCRPGLVPLTWSDSDLKKFKDLAGVSFDSIVTVRDVSFHEKTLFTHKGLSGPAILQVSSYWHPPETIHINLLPRMDVKAFLKNHAHSKLELRTHLRELLPQRLADTLCQNFLINKPLNQYSVHERENIAEFLQDWAVIPSGTEGYAKAEVTVGGVDTNALSSQSMESLTTPGLFFIGEVVDVTGWLGGYNFQWAWASGYAAGQFV